MKTIPLEGIPSTPALVADALAGREKVDFGFPLSPDAGFWTKRSEQEAQQQRPRELIVQRLLDSATQDDAPEAVLANIEALRDPHSLAVVTGQQVGLGGGPLLTLYKALTTVTLARSLEKSSGVRTVPLFWMATSDHNLAEAEQLHWITLDNQLAGYPTRARENRSPVGSLPLGERASELIALLREAMPETDFTPELFERLEAAYRPEHSFGEAFRKLAHSLLGQTGLVMFDPEDEEIKSASGPFWERAVEETDDRLERLIERSDAIAAAGYKVQAPVETGRPAIFVLEDGQRRKVVLEGRAIRARSDLVLSREELARIATEQPESLSAGVTLRPLLQNWLLPAGAYVAGPHEMAYWAQMSEAFEPLGLQRPAVVPRASLTLIEGKVRRRLDKLEIEAHRFFEDLDALYKELMGDHREDHSDETLAQVRASMEESEKSLLALTEQREFGGLDNAVDGAFRKIRYQLEKLEKNFNDRVRRQHADLEKHWNKLRVHLRPEGQPQERVVSPLYYMARYGSSLVDSLLENLPESIGKHGLLDLQEEIS